MLATSRATLLLALLLLQISARDATSYQVVVHPENKLSSVERKFLADVFLKKTTLWPNGEVVRPTDLDAGSLVRERFSQDILGRTVAATKNYWQQMIFSGRDLPPPEFETDDAVIKYVLKFPGAVGYVSGNANLGAAKILAVKP